MKGFQPLLFWLYRCVLVIYPLRLRFAYRDQMLQTLRDSCADRSSGKLRFCVQDVEFALKNVHLMR